jgi:hypothetical protein
MDDSRSDPAWTPPSLTDDNRRNERDPREHDESERDRFGSSDFDDWGDGRTGDHLAAEEGRKFGPAWRGTGGSSGRGAYGGGGEPGDERSGYAPEGLGDARRVPYFGSRMGDWDESRHSEAPDEGEDRSGREDS